MRKAVLLGSILLITFTMVACSPSTNDNLEGGSNNQSATSETSTPNEADDTAGESGYEPLPLGEPLNLNVSLVEGEVVEAEIGPQGGQLVLESADGAVFKLTIPENAVFVPEVISMQRIDEAAGVPFDEPNVIGVHLEPEGLVLLENAQLTIMAPEGALGENLATFGTLAEGKTFHLKQHEQTQDGITIQINHFSEYGANELGLQELAAVQDRYDVDQSSAYIDNLIPIINKSVDNDHARYDLFAELNHRWFHTEVIVRLENASQVGDDPNRLDRAWIGFIWWLSSIGGLFDGYESNFGQESLEEFKAQFSDEVNVGRFALARALSFQIENANRRCIQNQDPDEAIRIYRWAAMAKWFDGWPRLTEHYPDWHLFGAEGLTEAWIGKKMDSCLVFEFQFVSTVNVPASVAGEDWNTKVRSNMTLDVESIDPGTALFSQRGNLTFEHYSVSSLKEGCKETIEPGVIEITLKLDINPRYGFQEILFIEAIIRIPERPVLGFACGQLDFNPQNFSWWYRGYNDAMEDNYADGSGGYRLFVPIVHQDDTYALLGIEGTSKYGARHDSGYRLVHTPSETE